MKILRVSFVCAVGVATPLSVSGETSSAVLVVKAHGFENTKGDAAITVFKSADGFPSDSSKAVALTAAAISKGAAKAEFKKLKPGKYAVIVLHDENKNRKMDTNWIGIPAEGYGVSNGARNSFSAPKFTEAAFELPKAGRSIAIEIEY